MKTANTFKKVEGYDHFNGCPLFNVVGINNEYVGECHKVEADAIEEMNDLQSIY